MNVSDRRRLLGPVGAEAIKFSSDVTTSAVPAISNKASTDIRKMFLKRGLISNANGSAYLEVDGTIIEVSVFGPKPIRGSFTERASIAVETKFLPYIQQPNEHLYNGDSSSKTAATNIEQKINNYLETCLLSCILLDKYPKSSIEFHITIISNSSNLLNLSGWISNCLSIALIDSGIEIKDIISSGNVRMNVKDQKLVMDPEDDLKLNEVDCLVSFLNFHNDEIIGLWIDGDFVEDEALGKLIGCCNKMSKEIRSSINGFLLGSIKE